MRTHEPARVHDPSRVQLDPSRGHDPSRSQQVHDPSRGLDPRGQLDPSRGSLDPSRARHPAIGHHDSALEPGAPTVDNRVVRMPLEPRLPNPGHPGPYPSHHQPPAQHGQAPRSMAPGYGGQPPYAARAPYDPRIMQAMAYRHHMMYGNRPPPK
jgi:hypothetical protein